MRRKLMHFTFILASIFLTPGCSKTNTQSSTKTTIPVLTTSTVAGITQFTAVSGGAITSDGGAAVTAKGVCWSTTQKPTTVNSKTIDSSGTGSFTSLLTGLMANTIYYLRAYAINSVGTAYGNDVSFKTIQIGLPMLTTDTDTLNMIGVTTALSGVNVSSDSGAKITTCGVCWSINHNSTTTDSTAQGNGAGIGIFNCYLTGLTEKTTYYIRAFATNSVGTAYGNEVTIITHQGTVPVVYAYLEDNNSQSNNYGYANIPLAFKSSGGAPITAWGVYLSINPIPDSGNSLSPSSIGRCQRCIYRYTYQFDNLISGTVYYARAYASNIFGIGYGNIFSFTAK